MTITFIAELKETKQTKALSLDNVYSLKLITDDSRVMDLGKLAPDQNLKVTIELYE